MMVFLKLGPALKICQEVKSLKDELAKNWRQLAAAGDSRRQLEHSDANKISKCEAEIKLEPGLRKVEKVEKSRKVVIKLGQTVLAEKDFTSESDDDRDDDDDHDDEHLVMDLPGVE